jgi:hypothetical protein
MREGCCRQLKENNANPPRYLLPSVPSKGINSENGCEKSRTWLTLTRPRGGTMGVINRKIALLLVAGSFCLILPKGALAQACQDEESMVTANTKDLSDHVAKVRKESLDDFVKGFHQKSIIVKLSLSSGMVQEVVDCFNKAAKDATATKEQVDAYKAKSAAYAKLKAKIDQGLKGLKAANDPKQAKALIEKLDLST